MRFFWPIFWFFCGVLAMYAWISTRRKIRKRITIPPPRVDEDDIRRIVVEGALLKDDPAPLDLRQIKKEEDEFWIETWEEVEEL